MTWQALSAPANELGESPFWHPHEQMLYWIDIPGRLLLRANVFMGTVQTWAMHTEPGCIAPAASGGLVVALRDGIYRAREWGGELVRIAVLDYDPASVRANDGKCDALGRLWVGTIDEPRARRAAALFSIDCREGRTPDIQCHARDALTGNGLAWNPQGSTLYWADTPSHLIHAWDFDVQGNGLSAHRHWRTFAPKPAGWDFTDTAYQGRPDGAAVDVQGNYWVAMFEGRRLLKLAPDGQMLASFEVPAQCPTMPCFGGDDLCTLYVTTARRDRSAAELAALPQSGRVFSMRVDVPGLPVNFFRDGMHCP